MSRCSITPWRNCWWRRSTVVSPRSERLHRINDIKKLVNSMQVTVKAGAIEQEKTGAAVVLIFDGEKPGSLQNRLDKALGGSLQRLIKQGGFRPTHGSVALIYPESRIAAERVLLMGLGKRSGFSLERLRQAAGKAAPYLRSTGSADIVFLLDGYGLAPEEAAQAVIEGSMLGLYRFLVYKTGPDPQQEKDVRKITILSEKADALGPLRKGARAGEVIAEATTMVRDLVNAPARDMTPAIMAAKARALSQTLGLKLQVLERTQMERLGMGALLGVSSGSVEPPKFIIVEYRGGAKKPNIVLVGKAITFDSGGISLKPAQNMETMKEDMSGGAAVLGTIQAAAMLKLPLNIIGLLPATENMPSGSAYKPGDVLRTMSGKTIEITNTDAEGRLILSDALAYGCRYKPALMVDVATLTGACSVALGHEAIGMLGTSDLYKEKMRKAGEESGERVWELPLWEEYQDYIKSDIADMKNTGGRAGGVIAAAALLSRFVQNYPWVHLDIAATSWTDKGRPYAPKGATGVGVRILTQFLRDYAASTK